MNDAPTVEAVIESDAWAALADPEGVAVEAAAIALAEAGADRPHDYEIAVLFTDDAAIAELNERFRGRAKPTNVLSFPSLLLAPPSPGARPPAPPPRPAGMPPLALGDVALAAETVALEARARGLDLRAHVSHLICHGVLHLLGFDHAHAADAALMEGLERRALARIGVADPFM